MLEDDFRNGGHFYRYPYQTESAYIATTEINRQTKPWAARLDVEYIETFDRLDNLAGHLLIETAPRLGLDTSVNHLEERMPNGRYDSLQIGDCNFVYRFAQGTWGEFRTGLGFNWLDDDDATNFGFNFTYSADFYPQTLGRLYDDRLWHNRPRRPFSSQDNGSRGIRRRRGIYRL